MGELSEWLGQSTVLNFNVSDGTGTLDETNPDIRYHFALTLFSVWVACMGIIFMNVYIGLLSTIYEDGKARKHQLHCHLQATVTYKILIYRMTLPRCWCKR